MANQIITPEDIREAVRDRYGRLADTQPAAADTSCCGPADASTEEITQAVRLYDGTLLKESALPADITNFSLGCGDPITLASLDAGLTVLDLGSGAGLDAFLAAKQVGPEGRVIGVDMTDEMLSKANANKAKLGEVAHNVDFRKGFIEDLPVEDNSVDVIVSNCVINLSPDKPRVFRESFRVLKPGGRLAVSDIVLEGDFSEEARANMDGWAACVTGAIDAGDYVAAIEAAGFVDIELSDKESYASDTYKKVESRRPGVPRIYSARVTARKPHN